MGAIRWPLTRCRRGWHRDKARRSENRPAVRAPPARRPHSCRWAARASNGSGFFPARSESRSRARYFHTWPGAENQARFLKRSFRSRFRRCPVGGTSGREAIRRPAGYSGDGALSWGESARGASSKIHSIYAPGSSWTMLGTCSPSASLSSAVRSSAFSRKVSSPVSRLFH